MTIDTTEITDALTAALLPDLSAAITKAVATSTQDHYRREVATVLGDEISACARRMARSIVSRLEADPQLIADLTAMARAGLLDGVKRGAEEAGVKMGGKIAASAVQAQQIALIAGGK